MAGIQGQPSANPRQLDSPVPGATAKDIYNTADTGIAQVTGKAAPTTDIYAASDTGITKADTSTGAGMGAQALDATGRMLDYVGGFNRAGLASVAGLASGQGEIVTPADLKAAAIGKGPNSAEYLRRLGVSEGGSLNLPGLGRVTLRGAEGLALDIATDPLTLVARAAKEFPAIQKLLNAPGKATEALGEAVYKSAVTAKTPGKAAIAGQALVEAGAPVVGEAALAQKISDTAGIMGNLRQGLYDKFAELGGKIGMPKDLFPNAEGVLKNLRTNPTLRPMADEFEGMLNQYKGEGWVSMEQMSNWKTQLYDSLPKNAFQGAKLSNPGKMFKSALAHDFKNAIVDAGNAVEKGLGDSINGINDKWGALLEASPTKAVGGGSLGKSIDAVAIAAGGVPAYLKKKALEVATGPLGKTLVGRSIINAGKKRFINSLNLGNTAIRQEANPDQGQGEPQ